MQYLKTATLALIMATLVLIAGFAGLTTCNQAGLPAADVGPTMVELAPTPEVLGLGPLPVLPDILPASARRVRGTGTVRIDVTGDATIDGGVGILDGRSGAILAWRGIESSALPLQLDFEAIPAGRHTAVLAPDRASARYGYWQRTPLEVQATGAEFHGAAALTAIVRDVQIQIEWLDGSDGVEPIVLPMLRRVGDPLWSDRGTRPRQPLTIAAGELVLRSLGAGDYTLTLDGADMPDGPVALTVPSTSSLQVRCRHP